MVVEELRACKPTGRGPWATIRIGGRERTTTTQCKNYGAWTWEKHRRNLGRAMA